MRVPSGNNLKLQTDEIALKSANECKYWLCILKDGLKLDVETLYQLIDEANQISKIIASIIIKVKQQK